jgi:hypothetical protein
MNDPDLRSADTDRQETATMINTKNITSIKDLTGDLPRIEKKLRAMAAVPCPQPVDWPWEDDEQAWPALTRAKRMLLRKRPELRQEASVSFHRWLARVLDTLVLETVSERHDIGGLVRQQLAGTQTPDLERDLLAAKGFAHEVSMSLSAPSSKAWLDALLLDLADLRLAAKGGA